MIQRPPAEWWRISIFIKLLQFCKTFWSIKLNKSRTDFIWLQVQNMSVFIDLELEMSPKNLSFVHGDISYLKLLCEKYQYLISMYYSIGNEMKFKMTMQKCSWYQFFLLRHRILQHKWIINVEAMYQQRIYLNQTYLSFGIILHLDENNNS